MNPGQYEITDVQEIDYPAMRQRFGKRRDELQFDLVWNLYHGTRNAMAVIEQGFDMNKARGGKIGKGIYFADNAAKSNIYARPRSGDSIQTILQCQVVLGRV